MSSGTESEFTTQRVDHAGLMPRFEAEVREAQVNLGTGGDIMGRAEHHESRPNSDPSAVVIQDDGVRTVLGGLQAPARTSEPVFMLNGMRPARVESVAPKIPAAELGVVEMPETRGTVLAEELIQETTDVRTTTEPGSISAAREFHHDEAGVSRAGGPLFMDDTFGKRGDDLLIVDDSPPPDSGHGVTGDGRRADVPDDKGENRELGDAGSAAMADNRDGTESGSDQLILGISATELVKYPADGGSGGGAGVCDTTGLPMNRSDLVIYREDGGVIIIDGQELDSTTITARPDGIDRNVWGDQLQLFTDVRDVSAAVVDKSPDALARLIATYKSLLVGETANAVDISRIVGYLQLFAETRADQQSSPSWITEEERYKYWGAGRFITELEKLDDPNAIRIQDVYEAVASTDELLTYAENSPEIHYDLNMLQSYLIERLIRHTEAVHNGSIIRNFGDVTVGFFNKLLIAQQLRLLNVDLLPEAKSVLNQPENAFPKQGTSVDVVGIRVSDLFLGQYSIPLEPILEYADKFNLQPCPAWVAPLMEIQGRTPVTDGMPHTLFVVAHGSLDPRSNHDRIAFDNEFMTVVNNQVDANDTVLFARPKEENATV